MILSGGEKIAQASMEPPWENQVAEEDCQRPSWGSRKIADILRQLGRPGRGGLPPPAYVLGVEGGPVAGGARGGQGCRTAGGPAPKI